MGSNQGKSEELLRRPTDPLIEEVVRKSKENPYQQLQDEDLQRIKRSKSFNVIADIAGKKIRLAKILFAKPGGIRVAFPSFYDARGLLSEVEHGTGKQTADVSLTEEGFLTTHLVKYSHYSDGEAHFSQDKRIFTKVRRKAAPLKEVEGHVFTIYCRGLSAFTEYEPSKSGSATEVVDITYVRGSRLSSAIKLTGYLFSFAEAKKRCLRRIGKGGIGIVNYANELKWGIMMAESVGGALDEHLLLLTYEEPQAAGRTDPYLLFIGGFDPIPVAGDLSQETRFLALIYPANDFDVLKDELQSVDFPGSRA